MSEIIPELQSLYEALKAGKVGGHITKINWGQWPRMLSIRNAWGGEYNDRIMHIGLDEDDARKFTYEAISNEGTNNPEKYLTLEEKKGVSQSALLEVAYRLLSPRASYSCSLNTS